MSFWRSCWKTFISILFLHFILGASVFVQGGDGEPTTILQNLDSDSLSHILHPRHDLAADQVGAMISISKAYSNTLSDHVKFYYFANRKLGLDWKDASSSIRAFRNCQYVTLSERIQLAKFMGENSHFSFKYGNVSAVSPSFCPLAVSELVEDVKAWWGSYDLPAFAPIPRILRITLAYYCSSLRDPYYLHVLGAIYLTLELEQAFFYEESRVLIYQSLVEGLLTKERISSWNHSSITLRHSRSILMNSHFMSSMAWAQNYRWIDMYNGDRGDELKVVALSKIHMLIDQFEHFNHAYVLMKDAFAEFVQIALDSYLLNPDIASRTRILAEFRRLVVRLLDTGLDVNILSANWSFVVTDHPILRIARLGCVPILKVLVDLGLRVNQLVSGSYDLLKIAVGNWSPGSTMVSYLLEQGAYTRLNYTSTGGILHTAINMFKQRSMDDVSLIELLVSYGADPFSVHPSDDYLPVFRASFAGCLLTVDYLVHLDKVGYIMQRTISPERNFTLFVTACLSSHPLNVLPYFLGGYGGPLDWDWLQWDQCEFMLMQRGHVDLMKEVVRVRWTLNNQGNDTYFARSCVLSQSMVLLKLLLERGANINEVDLVTGYTCLTFALTKMNRTLIEFLFKHDLSVAGTTNVRRPPSSFPGAVISWVRTKLGCDAYTKSIPIVAAAGAGSPYFNLLLEYAESKGVDLFPTLGHVHAALRAASCRKHAGIVQFLSSLLRPSSKS